MAVSTNLTNNSVNDFLLGNFTVANLSDVNDATTPTLDHVLIGNGTEWTSQLLSANLEVLLDNTSIGTQPAINFLNGGSTVIGVVNDGANNELEVTITALSPDQNLADVVNTQTSLNNLLDTANTITTTGRVEVGTFQSLGSLYYPVNEESISADAVLEEDTGNARSYYFQFINPDSAAATTNLDLPSPAVGSTGLSYFIVNTGSAETLVVRNSAAATLATLLPGEQVKAIWAEVANAWVLV